MVDDAERCHLAYLTANDRRGFVLDFLHFRNMARFLPGVAIVDITIAVSRVRPISKLDILVLDELVRCTEAAPWLNVCEVVWKGNVGRDFSSAEVALKEIAKVASDVDYVMVRNRSGFGPFMDSWYRRYIDQYEKHAGTGLVGSTINFSGLSERPDSRDTRHVQTYAYLSQWRHLAPLADNYPGSKCTDKLDVIAQGEIGLSRQIMERGLHISCLLWPQHVFSFSSLDDPSLPRADIKEKAVDIPFKYKFGQYGRSPYALFQRVIWFWRLMSAALLRLFMLTRSEQVGQNKYLYVGGYD